MIPLASTGRATLARRALAHRPRTSTNRTCGRRPQSTNTSKAAPDGGGAGVQKAQGQTAGMSTTSTAQTIPMAANYWLQPLQTPIRHYIAMNQRRPYATQLLSTLTIWLFGDVLGQYITWDPSEAAVALDTPEAGGRHHEAPETVATTTTSTATSFSEAYDPRRTARSLIIGGIASIPSYRWFLWLGTLFNYRSLLLSLSAKVVFNQLTFTPVFNTYFFGMHQALSAALAGERPRWRDVWHRVRHTVPTSCWDSCKLWPAVTAFSFWAVPPELRSPFAGVIAIGWQTYLSMLNQRAARQQALEAAAAAG